MNDNTRKKLLGKLVNCFSPYGSCVGCEFQIMKSSMTCRIDKYNKVIKEIEAEAIKEFAERLKALDRLDVDVSYGYGREHYTEAIAVNLIDNLVKEMVGGDKVQWSKQGECPMTPEQFNAIYDDEMVGEEK